ncbi:MAG: hypothetical protein K0R82_2451, partial [Flavipsychrobacter sp.]|nr:hypothetical protein [Flavipsychrobacter sp.]
NGRYDLFGVRFEVAYMVVLLGKKYLHTSKSKN